MAFLDREVLDVHPRLPVPHADDGHSFLYVGVYIGEAVSAQIATAFGRTHTPWNDALKAIGIVGLVVAVMLRLVAREPCRKILNSAIEPVEAHQQAHTPQTESFQAKDGAASLLLASVKHVVRMKSFWLLTLAAGARQFSGNVFGYYMPSYLLAQYPSKPNLLSHYGDHCWRRRVGLLSEGRVCMLVKPEGPDHGAAAHRDWRNGISCLCHLHGLFEESCRRLSGNRNRDLVRDDERGLYHR